MKNLLMMVLIVLALNVKAGAIIGKNSRLLLLSTTVSDTTFAGLKDTAQKNISRFINAMTKNPKGCRFLVKSDFAENGRHEHLWSQVKVYSNGIFKGTFIDSPLELTNIKTGDKVTIKKSAVEDWAVFDRKGLRVDGNYSDKYVKLQKL